MEDQSDAHASSPLPRIKALLDAQPSTAYATERSRMRELRDLIQDLIAERLEAPLNEALAAMPRATRAEKADLSKWLNAEMREVGVAIRCPRTGAAAAMHVGPGHIPERGRFQFLLIDPRLPGRYSLNSTDLPTIKLMGFADRGSHRDDLMPTPLPRSR